MKKVLETIGKKPGKYLRTIDVKLEKETLAIPVHIARGRREGPVLLIAAGEHGTEVNGVAAVDRIFQEVSCDTLRGTLVALPAVNPRNIESRGFQEDVNTQNAWDTCYIWPGDFGGTPAERIAATLAASLINDADVVINIHAWSWYSSSCAFTWRKDRRAVRLVKAFGLPFMDTSFACYCDGRKETLHPKHDMLAHYVMARGKSAMLVELRTHHWQFPDSVAAGMRGLRNVLISMGMIPGKETVPAVQFENTGKETIVRAPGRGLYVPLKEIADRVKKGDTLGYLMDLQTGKRTVVKSPCAGAVWLNSRVGKGECSLVDMHSFADRGDMITMIKEVKASRGK